MRFFLVITTLIFVFSYSCKTKHKSEVSGKDKERIETDANDTRTIGKVSHQYRSGGCATVITIKEADKENIITLIPSMPLAKEFDVDGLTIKFNYQPLKMRNPDGCSVGIPAEITNISKK